MVGGLPVLMLTVLRMSIGVLSLGGGSGCGKRRCNQSHHFKIS
jgi:hypothetical protein